MLPTELAAKFTMARGLLVQSGMLIPILLVAAFVLLCLAALNVPSSKISLGWSGLACAMLAWLITNWPK